MKLIEKLAPQMTAYSKQFHTDGSVEWLPLESIVFNQAKARLINEVKLAQDATYMG